MVRVEELRFDDHTIRLALLENRWWIFCDDAAPQIDQHLSAEKLFADTPERERQIREHRGELVRISRIGAVFASLVVQRRDNKP